MNKDRIQRFIDLLKADAANPKGVKFDMGVWTHPEGAVSRRDVPVGTKEVKVDCGTHACALGLAAISGVFKDDGLSFRVWTERPDDSVGMLIPTFGTLQEYEAGAAFLGITQQDANVLFDNNYYPYEKTRGADAELEVVKRLEYLLEHHSLASYPID